MLIIIVNYKIVIAAHFRSAKEPDSLHQFL